MNSYLNYGNADRGKRMKTRTRTLRGDLSLTGIPIPAHSPCRAPSTSRSSSPSPPAAPSTALLPCGYGCPSSALSSKDMCRSPSPCPSSSSSPRLRRTSSTSTSSGGGAYGSDSTSSSTSSTSSSLSSFSSSLSSSYFNLPSESARTTPSSSPGLSGPSRAPNISTGSGGSRPSACTLSAETSNSSSSSSSSSRSTDPPSTRPNPSLSNSNSSPIPSTSTNSNPTLHPSIRPPSETPSRKRTFTWLAPPRVLLVDDDVVYRMLSGKLLQVFGCMIDIAGDGAAAVRKMGLGKYDLVFMDIMMPKLDGRSATSLIRKFDHLTPIISVTSNYHPDEVVSYYSSGMNDVLPKPFTRDGVFGILEKHLVHLKAIQSPPSAPPSSPAVEIQSPIPEIRERSARIGTTGKFPVPSPTPPPTPAHTTRIPPPLKERLTLAPSTGLAVECLSGLRALRERGVSVDVDVDVDIDVEVVDVDDTDDGLAGGDAVGRPRRESEGANSDISLEGLSILQSLSPAPTALAAAEDMLLGAPLRNGTPPTPAMLPLPPSPSPPAAAPTRSSPERTYSRPRSRVSTRASSSYSRRPSPVLPPSSDPPPAASCPATPLLSTLLTEESGVASWQGLGLGLGRGLGRGRGSLKRPRSGESEATSPTVGPQRKRSVKRPRSGEGLALGTCEQDHQ